MRRLRIAIGYGFAGLLWFLSGAKAMLDWVGRIGAFQDIGDPHGMTAKALEWLFATPWWVPGFLAFVLTIFVMWLNWPRRVEVRSVPVTNIAPSLRLQPITIPLAQSTATQSTTPPQPKYTKFDAEALLPALRDLFGILNDSVRDSTTLVAPFKLISYNQGFGGLSQSNFSALRRAIQDVFLFEKNVMESMHSVIAKNPLYRSHFIPILERISMPQVLVNSLNDLASLSNANLSSELMPITTTLLQQISGGLERNYQSRVEAMRHIESQIDDMKNNL